MKRLLLCLLLLTSCTKAYFSPLQDNIDKRSVVERTLSTPIRGYDFLGAAKQDCTFIAQTIDPNTAFGVLSNTFGNDLPCLTTVINSGKIVAVRVHLLDGTVNNHACSGNLLSSTAVQLQADRYRRFSLHFPDKNITWYLSPVLEHGCRDSRVVNSWFNQISKGFPNAIKVCSSNGQGYCPPGILKENHGGGSGDITSNDGVSIFDSDSAAYLKSGKVLTLGWSNCCNGRVSGEHPGDVIPLPPNRVNWCTHSEIRQLVLLMRDATNHPNINGCQDVVNPELLKTNAEYYGVGHDDGRGNKPLLILNRQYSRISLQTLKNMEVAFMTYYGLYGKQFRHYEGGRFGSNLTPDQLFDKFGGEWGLAKMSNKCYYFNSIRRQGYFR